jgi:Predicted Zn peptidase
VNDLRESLGISQDCIGIDMMSLCKKRDINVAEVGFRTNGFRGMAYLGNSYDNDAILLNNCRSLYEHNYDCGHEFVHLSIHREEESVFFKCFDKIYSERDSFVEWQANEGAAELLIPYRTFLPIIRANCNSFLKSSGIASFKKRMAEDFKVSAKVIEYRLDSLKYEINQYLYGTSIDDLKILSCNEQKKQKIKVRSINDWEKSFREEEICNRNKKSFINFDSIIF